MIERPVPPSRMPRSEDGRPDDVRREFTKLYGEAYPRLFRLTVSLVGDLSDADDVLQDVSSVLWQKFGDFRPGTSFFRWASQVTVHVARNFCRKRRTRKHFALSDAAIENVVKVHAGAGELLELRNERVQRCLDAVHPRDRQMLLDCYGDETSAVDWAAARGLSPSTVRSRLNRLRSRLVDCVERHLRREV